MRLFYLFMGSMVVFACALLINVYKEKIIPCSSFQTTFIGKQISFPIKVEDAAKKYHLSFNRDVGRSVSYSETDTLMIADSRDNSSEMYGLVFYFREMTNDDINHLKETLEKQYGKKFEKPSIYGLFQIMKIQHCVYLLLSYSSDTTLDIFKGFSKKRVTCRVGFYYGLTEKEVISTSVDGHIGIIGKGYEAVDTFY